MKRFEESHEERMTSAPRLIVKRLTISSIQTIHSKFTPAEHFSQFKFTPKLEAVKWLERLERDEISSVTRRDIDVELTPHTNKTA